MLLFNAADDGLLNAGLNVFRKTLVMGACRFAQPGAAMIAFWPCASIRK